MRTQASLGIVVALACCTASPRRRAAVPPPTVHPVPAAPARAVTAVRLRANLPHTSNVDLVAFSPDGRAVASGDGEGGVLLWDARTGKPLGALPRQERRITALAFSPDGRELTAGSSDRLAIWDVASRSERHRLPDHADIILDARYVGAELRSVDVRNQLRRWTPSTGALLETIDAPTIHELTVTIAPDGQALAMGGYGSIALWDVATRKERFRLSMPRCDVAPGDLLCVTWREVEMEEFGGGMRPTTHKESRPNWYIGDLAFAQSGALLAAGRADGAVILIDTRAGKPTARFAIGDDQRAAVALSEDGGTLAAGNGDGQLTLFDVASGSALPVTHEAGAGISALAFSPDGKLLVAAGPGAKATLWELTR